MAERIDHDGLFKQLLSVFFREFIELFLPEVMAYIEPDSLRLIDKEILHDIPLGSRHILDLVAMARYRGQEAWFLVHVETQASRQHGFPRRMYRYYSALQLRHPLPVYPIALITYDRPRVAEPDGYGEAFPDLEVLRFRYRVIQLNLLDYRHYLKTPNPVAAALMSRMGFRPDERVRVCRFGNCA